MQEVVSNKSKSDSEHNLFVVNRENLSLTGVLNVEGFSDTEIVLITNFGKMTLKGREFSITNVNVETGDFSMTGKIDSIIYSKKMYSDDEKFVKRLFK